MSAWFRPALVASIVAVSGCSSKFSLSDLDPEGVGGDDIGFQDGTDSSDGTDGRDDDDADSDGWPASEDCDDTDPERFPGAEEICDDKDNDCNGEVDEGVTTTFYADADGDGHGRTDDATEACALPGGYAARDGDCDDTTSAVYPGATEVCDEQDNDCDGETDEDVAAVYYADTDGDGFGAPGTGRTACTQPDGHVANDGDCDDSSEVALPGGTEICDGLDNDCNGVPDDGVGTTWYLDADSDGYGLDSATTVACSQPSGYVDAAGDCNDGSASINPGASELCNGLDDDCDATTSEVGAVDFTTTGGVTSSATGTFTGTAASPAALTLSRAGTYTFCAGTYYVNLDVEADVTLEGAFGASSVTLDGGGAGSVVNVETDGIAVAIDDLTVTGGSGDGTAFDITGTGGGVNCEASSTLTVTDSVFSDNDAVDGGGLAVDGCTLSLEDSEVSDNTAVYGAGMDFGNATATLSAVVFDGNSGATSGGNLYVSADSADTAVTASASTFTDGAATYGAAFFLNGESNDAVLTLDQTEVTSHATSSTVFPGAALLFDSGSALYVTQGDWGTSSNGDDNGTDVTTVTSTARTLDYDEYGEPTWFQCDSFGCEAYEYAGVSGTMDFFYGDSTVPNDFDCELVYAVTGDPAASACDDCAFAFDLDLAYDASQSTNSGCSTADLAWTVGYVPEPDAYSFPVLYYAYGGSWEPVFAAYFDGTTLLWAGGDYNTSTATGYYTLYWYGDVQPY